ncbi:MAG TPA: 30S ribosomal protein S20 [Verrucomicrobiales bacterium]|jgi:small subunit ribosomal protein S20|nr:30S ribosomal protein S20 [Verrucomicrobiales bacterium]
MANIKSAEKRVRQTATRTLRNKSTKTRVKNARKSALEAVKAGDKTAGTKVAALASAADKAANKGVIHRNKANRIKARIARDQKKTK